MIRDRHTQRKCIAEATCVRLFRRRNETALPGKIDVTSVLPVGRISVVTLIRTDTTLDHSQKAEKVCLNSPKLFRG